MECFYCYINMLSYQDATWNKVIIDFMMSGSVPSQEKIARLLKAGGLCVLVNHSFFVADPASRLTRRIHRTFGQSRWLRTLEEHRRPFYLTSILTTR